MLKNKELAVQVLDLIQTLIEAAEYLLSCAQAQDYENFTMVSEDMIAVLECINGLAPELKQDEPSLNIDLAVPSVYVSLRQIMEYNMAKAAHKIEFELIPLIQDMHVRFYFFGTLYPDQQLMDNYYQNELSKLAANKYIDEAERTGTYKYDLSAVVIGYNKLDYTKLCVESFLEHVPKDLNYELILLNHGSSDGTKAYFESKNPHKQMDIHKNGGGFRAIDRILEGKYAMFISNDVVITENAIANMMRCMDSDEKIGAIVPTTPNISNCQGIEQQYTNFDEMHAFARKNNVYDPYRHEKRTRLCDPIVLFRSKYLYASTGVNYPNHFYSTVITFGDDLFSLKLRRRGYSLILQKDAFCYHFGSVTVAEENNNIQKAKQIDLYFEGRKDFFRTFGVDPWATGCCFAKQMVNLLPFNQDEPVNVLGVNCGFGSNPLKIQQKLKEDRHNTQVTVYNTTDDQSFVEDLRVMSDVFEYCESIETAHKLFETVQFHYIVLESRFDVLCDLRPIIANLMNRLTKDGVMAIRFEDETSLTQIKQLYCKVKVDENWAAIFKSENNT